MAFVKYARFEGVQILDVRSSAAQKKTASLDKFAEFDNYRTSDDYLYVRIRAISSRVNQNHDSWPSVELAGSPDIFSQHRASEGFTIQANRDAKFGFSTFLGKPIFIDHNNSDPKRARGVVVDAKFHVDDHKTASLDPFYSSSEAEDYHLPPSWVELLLEVDAKSFPKFAKAIIDGAKDPKKGIDGFSMGANIKESYCNICNNRAEDEHQFCDHIRMKGARFNVLDPKTGKKIHKRAAEKCVGVGFFEISGVFSPADETALTQELITDIRREGRNKTASNWNKMLKEGAVNFMDEQRTCPRCGGVRDPEHGGAPCATCGYSEKIAAGEFPDVQGDEHYMEMPCSKCKGIGTLAGNECPYCQGEGVQDSGMYAKPRGDITGLTGRNPEDYQKMPDTIQDKLYNMEPAYGKTAADWSITEHPTIIPYRSVGGPDASSTPLQAYGPPDCPGCQAEAEGGNWCPTHNPGNAEGRRRMAADLPQADLLSVPEKVDTLRKEETCPVCGSEKEHSEKCEICGYSSPPDSLDNPDLTKSRGLAEQNDPAHGTHIEGYPNDLEKAQTPPPRVAPPNFQAAAHNVISDMEWEFFHPKLGMGKINPIERPVLPTGPPATNEPVRETIITTSPGPVVSNTAAKMIAAIRNKENQMATKTADAASGAPAVATPDANVNVVDVGGVMDASNEEASKAQAQVNVLDVGATGVTDVGADHDSIEQSAGGDGTDAGFNTDKTTEDSGPTITWDMSYGDGSAVENQEEPVTRDPFPASEDGVKAISSSQHTALQAEPGESLRGPDLSAGPAVSGTEPADPVGKAEDRVDVLSPATTPEGNNSGPTITWTGTNGNKILRQQEPVTNETLFGPDGVKSSSFTPHVVNAMKLADLEIEMGVLSKEDKYNRLAALTETSPELLAAQLSTLSRVKTAGLKRPASITRTAGRVPSFNKAAAASHPVAPAQAYDEQLFM